MDEHRSCIGSKLLQHLIQNKKPSSEITDLKKKTNIRHDNNTWI